MAEDAGQGLDEAEIRVWPVTAGDELKAFIRLPDAIYADDPAFIAPLHAERRLHLSRHNPFFRHGEGQLFLARRGERVVGRISAQVSHLHAQCHPDEPRTGFFGFLEGEDHPAIFRALLEAAADWLRVRGIERMQGPFSWSINQESGLLVEGFDTPPAVMMGHARPWYDAHVRAAGLRKAMDLLAYDYTREMEPPHRLRDFVLRLKRQRRLWVRPLARRRLARELDIIRDIFNDAWSRNWGFLPFTAEEMREFGNVLRWIVGENDVAIATWKGEPAAMAVLLPDINRMIADFDGRLLPFNWARLIWRLKFAGPPRRMRMVLMGVRRRFHNTPIGAALAFAVVDEVYEFERQRGVQGAELSWVLETNRRTRKIIESIGARHYKTYRIYERDIA